MKKRIGNRVVGKVLAAAVGAVGIAGIGQQQADASLVIDVRAASVTGGAVLNNSKSVTFTATGQTVTLNLFAQIRGTNSLATDETITSAQGSVTTTGALLGNLSFGGTRDSQPGDPTTDNPGVVVSSNRADPFDGLSSADGDFVDLDADGDIDAGSTGNNPDNYFVARAPAATGGTAVGAGSPGAGRDKRIGFVTFTYTGGDGSSLANFVVRTLGGNPYFSAAVWSQDGAGKTPDVATYAAGTGVTLQTVPEPTGLALAAVSSIGLLARRRNRSV
jgi:hypothetical protein